MKVILVLVLSLIAIAYGQRLPFPEDLKEKIPDWDKETPPTIQRIIGGTAVANGGRPFQIMLLRSGSFTCGGSFIANNKVLTAAHCVAGSESSPTLFTVRYNTLSASSGSTVSVSRISRHASYSSSTIDYDVAVLTLASNFSPGTNAAVVTLASSAPASGAAAIVSGFGRTSGGGAVSSVLLQTTLNIVAQATCQQTYGSINTITARMVCANASGKGSCNGDSGGPLTVGGQQVGVVSWGVSGCLTTYPSVFANSVNLRSWITSQ
jgi:trypsin